MAVCGRLDIGSEGKTLYWRSVGKTEFFRRGVCNIDLGPEPVNRDLTDTPMIVPLSRREIELLLGWKERAFWPDEDRVRRKLQQALEQGEPPVLSRLQVEILQGWAEEQLGARYGGGAVLNPEEGAVRRKLQEALGEGG